MYWETETDMYTHCYVKQTTIRIYCQHRARVCAMLSTTQYAIWGKNLKKNEYMYLCN